MEVHSSVSPKISPFVAALCAHNVMTIWRLILSFYLIKFSVSILFMVIVSPFPWQYLSAYVFN